MDQKIIKPNKIFEVNLDRLDDSQREAVTSTADKILLKASAGSGKTNSLIAAIAAYRYEYLNDRICAITYTRAARAEMESRLQEMGIYDVEVTTIHVWSRNLLEQLGKKYNFKIKILEQPQIKSILTEITTEYLKRSKLKSVNIDILYNYITGSKNMDISDGYRAALNALERRYIAYKRDCGLYDFTDYPLYLFNVLKAFDEKIQIDALFVDEFQDVDPIQFELFNAIIGKKKFFVGDSWQSIYVFRGADGEAFDKAKDFEKHELRYNYRSYQEIIDYAMSVYILSRDKAACEEECCISEITYAYNSPVVCDRGYGGKVYSSNPYGRCYDISADRSLKIDINEAFKQTMDMNPMILCRTNKQVKAIEDLGYFNVSTIHQAKGLEYKAVIVVDMLISSIEDLNVAYVGMTRAEDQLMIMSWQQLEIALSRYQKRGGSYGNN